MPPKKDLASILFHKKKPPVAKAQPKAGSSPQKPRPPKAVAPRKQEDDDDDLHLPDGPYSDFKLFSSALNGWKYDVMKFDSRKPVDIATWPPPIKLNRKDLRKDDPAANVPGVPVGPMLGADGQPVLQDGKIVMVDAEGRIVQDEASKAKGAPAKKKFQKKTKQVFVVPEEVRLLRKEERYPWVLEDGMAKETWVAQLDDTTKAQTHAFFMPAANDVFKFVPAHRWYKFQKKMKHDLPTDTANVEAQYAKHQKRDPTAWLSQRTGRAISSQTAAMFKAEAEGTTVDGPNSLVHTSGQSLGPGGRRLKVVDNGMSGLFGDEEDGEGSRRQREKEYGEEGDLDEQEYEEEFADDDEKMEVDNDDEEAKELEERLKKEYKSANKTREGYIDDSDEEEKPKMSKEERRMQKLIRNREGGDPDDSDDENKNPYASSEESSEEEEEIPAQPVSQPPPPANETPANSQAPQTPKPSTSQPALNGSKSDVRATSPVGSSLSGHSVVAKRATSPKAPKLKPSGGSRGGSPLASRATSPVPVSNSRATSPVAGAGSRAGSPVVQNGKKRKADDGAASPQGSGQAGGPPKPKKRKSNAGPVPPLEDRMVIEWLKNTPNASTRDCIQHFTPFLRDEGKKAKFTALVKEVAQLKDGVLVLRAAYRSGGAPASPV